MSSECNPAVDRFKREAKLLRKGLKAADAAWQHRSAERFLRLRRFHGMNADDVIRAREEIQHKHALAVIAMEAGFPGWKEMSAGLNGGCAEEE